MNMRSAASIDLLVFLFAGVVWNFGFLLSSVDELRTQVERLVNEDELTGLASRRLFLNRLSRECAAVKRNSVFSLMLFDLDRFKSINDKHGHAAGDAALKHAA
jgi:GGDEF domain-containing protein